MNRNPNRRGLRIAAIIALMLAWTSSTSQAADHRDGPRATELADSDIADVFAFPVTGPEGSGNRLVLAMTVNPYAHEDAAFSDAIVYRFRLRRAQLVGAGAATRTETDASSEMHVACVFNPASDGVGQVMTCRAASSQLPGVPGDGTCAEGCIESTSFVGSLPDAGEAPPMKVFAGLRADPFFSDVARVRLPRRRRHPDATSLPGINTFGRGNVLAIVVELDIESVLGSSEMGTRFAVVAETMGRL